MGFKTIIFNEDSRVNLDNNHLYTYVDEREVRVFIPDINCIIFNCIGTVVSIHLINKLLDYNVAIIICNKSSDPVGCFLPFNKHSNVFKQLNKQVNWNTVRKKQLWQSIIKNKIYNQYKVLDFYQDARYLKELSKSVKSGDTTNREAVAAKFYLQNLYGEYFTRDDSTTTNYALNYGYKILASYISKQIFSRGYLTQLGIHHIGESNAFNLTYDFIESFRSIVDLWVKRYIDDYTILTSEDRQNIVSILNCTVLLNGERRYLTNVISLTLDSYFAFLVEESEDILNFEISTVEYEN